MLQADITWDFGQLYIYYLESGEALIFSSPSNGGDGNWRYFPSHDAAQNYGGSNYDSLTRHKGTVDIESSFVEQVRLAGTLTPTPGTRYHRTEGYLGQEKHQAEMMRDLREA